MRLCDGFELGAGRRCDAVEAVGGEDRTGLPTLFADQEDARRYLGLVLLAVVHAKPPANRQKSLRTPVEGRELTVPTRANPSQRRPHCHGWQLWNQAMTVTESVEFRSAFKL